MALQKVEYQFPDPDAENNTEIEVEGSVNSMELDAPAKVEVEDELEIEIVDDVPAADRNRKPSDPPADVTDDELTEYSKKAAQRIRHFSKGYHDERRAKEEAIRVQQEMERFTKSLMAENAQLKGSVNKSHGALVEQAKKTVTAEIAEAKRQYKQAYDNGDSDALVEAQEALTTARLRMDKVNNIKVRSLQEQDNPVQVPKTATSTVEAADDRATAWAKENTWFGADDSPEMTAFALGLDAKLKREGIDPRSDTYYERLNSRMREVFPEVFSKGVISSGKVPQQRKSSVVVAPATRSTAPKKVTLTPSSRTLAAKLGLTLQQYAEQVAHLERTQNNG